MRLCPTTTVKEPCTEPKITDDCTGGYAGLTQRAQFT